MYRTVPSTQIQLNAAKLIGQRFMVQMDNERKLQEQAKSLKANEWDIFQWPSFNTKLQAERLLRLVQFG